MAPSKTPGQNQVAASDTFLKKQAQAQGLGAPNAPGHKEGHAPGEAPVASDSGSTNVGIEGGTTNIPGEKGISGQPLMNISATDKGAGVKAQRYETNLRQARQVQRLDTETFKKRIDMRIERRQHCEQFGTVQINGLQRVIELDAGAAAPAAGLGEGEDIVVPAEVLAAAEKETAIIIACMNEEYQTIEGVLSGVPHDCLVILVSNSDRPGRGRAIADRYAAEVRMLETFGGRARRSIIAVHQADPGVAAAFREAGMPELVDAGDGLVYRGKGEAMIIGMAVAAFTGRKYVGFVDADNFVPGSVTEYCKVFAAGLHSARSPYAMVRIAWNSKPKVREDRLVFEKKGRSSRVVNEWLNRLLEEHTGYGTDLVVTGNAGEHAMTIELGLQLRLARGYAIEPYELINILERFGCGGPITDSDTDSGHDSDSDMEVCAPPTPPQTPPQSQTRSSQPRQQQHQHRPTPAPTNLVEIMQIETRNPHFHDTTKGEEHVQDMQLQGLNALYHSPVAPAALRDRLLRHMVEYLGLEPGREPPRERTYPPLASALDFGVFFDVFTSEAASLRQIGLGAEVDVLLADRCAAGYRSQRRRRRPGRSEAGARRDRDDQVSPRSSSDGW
ncbi:hypothetical protein DL768_008528 [Monosporascus sp. mg162]|nr:hypothetical protein DL768_008528 [Monosporascus sp. mg162]